jgi:RNA polymerase sigma-70 factor (ECF subfamily)
MDMQTQDIWNLYANDIKYFILSKVKDCVVADDLLQEIFIKVHTKKHQLNEVSKLKPWLFSIARYTVADHFKHHDFTYKINVTDLIMDEQDQNHTAIDCLHGIIKNLPKKYRVPLFLSDIKGLKQREVAKQLQLPLPTVKSQIQRARKQIAQGFMDCCGFVINNEGLLVGEIQDKANCKVCY